MKHLLIPLLLSSLLCTAQQKQIAITIDDAPIMALPESYTPAQLKATNEKLLQKITALHTPVSIFINAANCITPERLQLLKQWVNNPLITLGSHTLNHSNCADLSIDSFKMEVMINDYIIRSVAKGKPVPYFRFPYNAMGKDSMAQALRLEYLKGKNYTAVPFTIESDDYMYETLYQDALKKKDKEKAKEVATAYIKYTLHCFTYFEQLTKELFGRDISQIYLCHVNQLNTDYYGELMKALQGRGYQFVSLEKAMQDKAYTTPVYYHQQYGFSWLFRWIPETDKRKQYLRNSPEPDIYNAYEALKAKK
ncbi:polysaccharide deacetylase family protein [Chitinophaga flava]|uniref:NodB homology domain-containing protein n=1 Tax=Chitinophaga flava TaxID=2259036 RepID=A0A365Y1L0_9BACT|nr:polysaccharide deacetylase family protein [Chitinophaga flava]RBL91804.1 hypothetical protein DF182_04160 [Chitinophaga flava]